MRYKTLTTKYKFTEDWFSHNISKWVEILSPLKNKPIKYLEIGSFEGRSAIWLHDHILTHPDSELHLIESGELLKNKTLEDNIKLCGEKKFCYRYYESRYIKEDYEDNTFDLIYIDGSHASCDVLRDGVNCFDLLKSGGLLCFDDYLWTMRASDGTTPKAAIDAFLSCYDTYIDIVDLGYQVWIRKIK